MNAQNPTGGSTIPIIAAIYNLAAFVSSISTAFVSMKVDRRNTIFTGNFYIIIGATLQATTFSVGQIVAGRIICGLGIGSIARAVSTYMVRCSQDRQV